MDIKRKHIVFILFCMVLWVGCKEKDCHETGECPPELYRKRLDSLKPYIWAKEGSWWIYKNTFNGQLDTQTVDYFKFDSAISNVIVTSARRVIVKEDYLNRIISSSNSNSSFNEFATPYIKNDFNSQQNIMVKNGMVFTLFYEFNTNFVLGQEGALSQYLGKDTTLTIQGNTYKDVISFKIDKDIFWYPAKDTVVTPVSVYYWAKNVGLVKRYNVNGNYSWELIDYHIVK